MSKVFLDTNMLIYSVDKDSPDKRDDALTLLKQIGHSGRGGGSRKRASRWRHWRL